MQPHLLAETARKGKKQKHNNGLHLNPFVLSSLAATFYLAFVTSWSAFVGNCPFQSPQGTIDGILYIL